jgi:prolyl 4-hydroxylase
MDAAKGHGSSPHDADAQFRAAGERLAHADSPHAFASSVALVEAAASEGHPEATCLLATLEAVGAGRQPDWHRSFDYLQLAAERGSPSAGGQLRLLSRMEGCSSEPGGGTAPDWGELRRRIDPERLLRVPGRTALTERPRLRVFEGFASPAECRWIIAKLRPKLAPAMIWDDATGLGKVDPARTGCAVELRLTEMDVVIEAVRARIAIATHLPEPIFEVPQVMHYSVGQEFTPHHDFLDPGQPGPAADIARRGQRMGTFLIYLNEDFAGGETEFPRAGLSYRGRTGDALFFANVTPDGRPDPLTLHAGRPPTQGEKWIFSQWIRDRLPGPPPC